MVACAKADARNTGSAATGRSAQEGLRVMGAYFFCDTVTVCPAIVSVPMRAPPAFAATMKVTVPLPLRPESLVKVIHGALLTTVHVQPDVVVTVTGPPFP